MASPAVPDNFRPCRLVEQNRQHGGGVNGKAGEGSHTVQLYNFYASGTTSQRLLAPLRLPTPHVGGLGMSMGAYNAGVEKVVRLFESHAEAEEADARFYAELTPQERIEIVIQLRDQRHPHASQQGLARVYRIVEFERG